MVSRKQSEKAAAVLLALLCAASVSLFAQQRQVSASDPYSRVLYFGTADEQYDAAMSMLDYYGSTAEELAAAMRDEGYQYGSRSFQEILQLFEKAADNGSVDAMLELGGWYEDGVDIGVDAGFKANPSLAAAYYQRAAELGSSEGWASLGYMAEDDGDFNKAIECYQKAANGGHEGAFYSIGNVYFNELAQYETGLNYYRQAVVRGDMDAMNKLGDIYLSGDHVQTNYADALRYYRMTIDMGNILRRTQYYASYAYAQYMIGVIYENGYGVNRDLATARSWYEAALSNHYWNAQAALDRLNR